jgi:hypothetical protein
LLNDKSSNQHKAEEKALCAEISKMKTALEDGKQEIAELSGNNQALISKSNLMASRMQDLRNEADLLRAEKQLDAVPMPQQSSVGHVEVHVEQEEVDTSADDGYMQLENENDKLKMLVEKLNRNLDDSHSEVEEARRLNALLEFENRGYENQSSPVLSAEEGKIISELKSKVQALNDQLTQLQVTQNSKGTESPNQAEINEKSPEAKRKQGLLVRLWIRVKTVFKQLVSKVRRMSIMPATSNGQSPRSSGAFGDKDQPSASSTNSANTKVQPKSVSHQVLKNK